MSNPVELRSVKREQQAEVVSVLEQALEMARAGRLLDVVVLANASDRTVWQSASSSNDLVALFFAFECFECFKFGKLRVATGEP